MRQIGIILCIVFATSRCVAQAKGGIEQYQYLGKGTANAIVPVLHFQNSKGWYAEARYNYDENNTFSLLGGRSFQLDKNGFSNIIPMIGVSFGNFEGITLAGNFTYERGIFFFNSQSQYTFSTTSRNPDFFFNWSEIGIQPRKWIFAGLSVQYIKESTFTNKLDPGIMVGFNWKSVSFPLYVFKNPSHEYFFILGLIWEWQQNNK